MPPSRYWCCKPCNHCGCENTWCWAQQDVRSHTCCYPSFILSCDCTCIVLHHENLLSVWDRSCSHRQRRRRRHRSVQRNVEVVIDVTGDQPASVAGHMSSRSVQQYGLIGAADVSVNGMSAVLDAGKVLQASKPRARSSLKNAWHAPVDKRRQKSIAVSVFDTSEQQVADDYCARAMHTYASQSGHTSVSAALYVRCRSVFAQLLALQVQACQSRIDGSRLTRPLSYRRLTC